MNKLSFERLSDFERDPSNNFLTRSEMMEAIKELIALREALKSSQAIECQQAVRAALEMSMKGEQVPVGWIKSSPNEAVSWDSVDPIYLAGSTEPVGWRSDYKPVYERQQKPVISKEKLCDWLEDNFDIDDSQRDAFAQCFSHHCNCIVEQDIE